MKEKKIAVVTVTSMNGDNGGAERLYDGLVETLNSLGVITEKIALESDESCFDSIKETYLKFYDLELSAYDAVISTKAPSYVIRHPNHICYLIHTMRVFYDIYETEFTDRKEELENQRKFIHNLDSKALDPTRIKKIFTIGHEVSNRLGRYNQIESVVLHPGLTFDQFKSGNFQNYLFMPGRLHRWKRVDLIIKAMKYVKCDIQLKIAGSGEDQESFEAMARGDHRIEFLGRISDQDLVSYYSNALAVPFVPLMEDYGYVTLEAFRSKKPVITCTDSGEPTHFVHDGISGLICLPDPKEIAKGIEWLYEHPLMAEEMGKAGYHSIKHISWENVGKKLVEAFQ
jgi:glycosyltransferase involved in cell wall biosynthesis